MSKDPAFLFYSSDFLSGITDLTMDERGQYITLLCVQHQKEVLSEKTIRLLLGSVSVDVMNKFTKDENGNFFNKRLREEIEKRNKFTESRRNNGNLGGRPKKQKEEKETDRLNLALTKKNLMENENESINEVNNEEVFTSKKINFSFSFVWDLYDKKIGDIKKLEIKWNKLKDSDREKIINHIPKYKESIPDKQFRKNFDTYLNNHAWNDEILTNNLFKNETNKRNNSEDRAEHRIGKDYSDF